MADNVDDKTATTEDDKKKRYWKDLPEDRERKTRNKLPQRFEDFATRGEGVDDSQSQSQLPEDNTQDWVGSAAVDDGQDDEDEDNIDEDEDSIDEDDAALVDDGPEDKVLKESKPKKRTVATKRKRAKTPRDAKPSKKRSRRSTTVIPRGTSSTSSFGSLSFGISSSSSSAFPIMPVEPSESQVKGVDNPAQWKFATSRADMLSKDLIQQYLNGCYFEPGVINGTMTPTVEICFSFDMTGSMASCLNELKWKLSQCATTLLSDLPNIRIAMIAHGDYCDALCSPMYLMKKMDFTNDLATFDKFVKSCGASGGGDSEECYEMCLHEAQQLNWSVADPNCMKVLVMIGDEVPHNTSDSDLKLDWRLEVAHLKKLLGGENGDNFHIYSIQCLNNTSATSFYQSMASETKGQRLSLDSFQSITEIFMGMCYRASADVQFRQKHEEIASNSQEQTIIRPSGSSGKIGDYVLTDDDIMRIHAAIHDNAQSSVKINDKDYEIALGRAGCRFASIDGVTYIEQNKEKKTKYAKMALEGKKITWIVHSGQWGLIVEDEIQRRGREASQGGDSQKAE